MKKNLAIILSILFVTIIYVGCVPSSNNIYPSVTKKPAREYTEKEVQSYINSVDKKFNTPGFKGLHLGMTINEVNELIKETPWGYAFSDNKKPPSSIDYTWKDQPQYKSSNFLKSDDSRMGWTGLLKIGCEGPEGKESCYWINVVFIRFYENKLVEITLPSTMWPADKIHASLKSWGEFALNGLTKRYGEPTKIYGTFSNVNITSFKAGYLIFLYQWDLGSDTVKLGINKYESKFGCKIFYENVKGVQQLEKEKSEGKSEL